MAARYQLKPLDQQVIVITGASSGIGLTTARMAADAGAKVVLAARSEGALKQLEQEINHLGHEAMAVVADVGKEEDVQHIADASVTRFGGFDTWINDAGISIYGELLNVPIEDQRRLFDTNFWGLVYGSLIAARHLRNRGGALINVGSVLSDASIPLQGMYSASKHAVKGFTDALRMELEAANAPVSVTLVKPGSINTPFPRHAKKYIESQPQLPAPVYAPDVVARTLLHCASVAQREVVVGGGGKLITSSGKYAPGLTERIMEATMYSGQKKEGEAPHGDALFKPSEDLSERGDYAGRTREHSLYTSAALHPWMTGALMLGAGIAAAAIFGGRSE